MLQVFCESPYTRWITSNVTRYGIPTIYVSPATPQHGLEEFYIINTERQFPADAKVADLVTEEWRFVDTHPIILRKED